MPRRVSEARRLSIASVRASARGLSPRRRADAAFGMQADSANADVARRNVLRVARLSMGRCSTDIYRTSTLVGAGRFIYSVALQPDTFYSPSRNNAGSTIARFSATPRCRCGPVTRPVAPTVADQIAGREMIADLHLDLVEMAVHRYQAVAVIDEQRVAVQEEGAGLDHRTGGGRADRRAASRRRFSAEEDAQSAGRAAGNCATPRATL